MKRSGVGWSGQLAGGRVMMPKRTLFFAYGLSAIVLVGIIAGAVLSPRSTDPCRGNASWTALKTQEAVTPRLKAPSTARYNPEPQIRTMADGTCEVVGWVDAQNSFGAMIRTGFAARLDPRDWHLVNVKFSNP